MTTELFVQLLVNGLSIGMIYVLVGSGLILLLGVVRIFNFAHGEFYMLGAFLTFGVCHFLHLNFFLAVLLSIIAITVLGMVSYKFIFRYLRGDFLLCTAASIGLSMIFMRGSLLGFGTEERGLRPPIAGSLALGPVQLPAEKVVHVHLNDAPDKPRDEQIDMERLLPGEGVIDLKGFLGALKRIGYPDYMGVETFSKVLPTLPPDESAAEAKAAVDKVMAGV